MNRLNLGGGIETVPNAVALAELAVEKGCQYRHFWIEAARLLFPDTVVERVCLEHEGVKASPPGTSPPPGSSPRGPGPRSRAWTAAPGSISRGRPRSGPAWPPLRATTPPCWRCSSRRSATRWSSPALRATSGQRPGEDPRTRTGNRGPTSSSERPPGQRESN